MKYSYIQIRWSWTNWTFGFWWDNKKLHAAGIDIGPLEIMWKESKEDRMTRLLSKTTLRSVDHPVTLANTLVTYQSLKSVREQELRYYKDKQ